MAVVDAFESGIVDLPDFYFTGDDYRYRFEPEAKQRFLDLLRRQFNSGVRYKGRALVGHGYRAKSDGAWPLSDRQIWQAQLLGASSDSGQNGQSRTS